MKLSELEDFVAAMREKAKDMDVDDPSVSFWSADSRIPASSGDAFSALRLEGGVFDNLREHVALMDCGPTKRGDFALPLCME